MTLTPRIKIWTGQNHIQTKEKKPWNKMITFTSIISVLTDLDKGQRPKGGVKCNKQVGIKTKARS